MSHVTYEYFKKLDLRVAKVIRAERIKGMAKIMKAVVDLGSERREMIVGGAEYYEPDYFTNKTVIVVANLQPRKIAGITSEGMLLAADLDGKPIWLTLDGDAPPGTRVT